MPRRRELLYKPLCDEAEAIELAREQGHLEELEALLELLRMNCGIEELMRTPDPWKLEALADFTVNPAEAVRIYRKAIAISETRGEQTYTKRIWMAARLKELGGDGEARSELMAGRAEAERLKGGGAVTYADELLTRWGD